jgi:hypothetical protein
MSQENSRLYAELCRHHAETATALAELTDLTEIKERCLRLAAEWLHLADEMEKQPG